MPRYGAKPQVCVAVQVAVAGSHQSPVLLSRTETSTVAIDRLSVTRPETTNGTSVELLLAGEVMVSVGRENW